MDDIFGTKIYSLSYSISITLLAVVAGGTGVLASPNFESREAYQPNCDIIDSTVNYSNRAVTYFNGLMCELLDSQCPGQLHTSL